MKTSDELKEADIKLMDELEKEVNAALEEASKEVKQPTNFFKEEENRK